MITRPLTVADLNGPVGPFLLEVLLTRGTYAGDHERQWTLVRSVASLDEGLRVASNMATCYDYRLFLGAAYGYLYLDWQEDTDGMYSPIWRTEPNAAGVQTIHAQGDRTP